MMRLPVCPYCGKKLDYKKSVAVMGEKKSVCKSCKKISKVKYKAACVKMGAVFVLLLIGLNTLMFFHGNNKTLLPHLIATVVPLIIFMVLTPLKVTLTEIEGQRDPAPKLKKNRHRHQKTRHDDVLFDEEPLKGTSFDK